MTLSIFKPLVCFTLLAGLLWPGSGVAQTIPDALFTAGTTTTDATGRHWVYLAFTPENPTVLRGRALAIYQKNGLPADPGSFNPQGQVQPELEVAPLGVFLARGAQLGENMNELGDVLYDIFRTRGLDRNALPNPLPTPPRPPLVEMLSSLLNRATGDAETAAALRMLGQAHPAVKMALGEAWALPLTVPAGTPVTLEVRETGSGGVVGRVTLTAGLPVVLPAPGRPVQVPDLSPKGDLNIKLRWAQSDDLRRQSPLSGGFNVWRITKALAASAGWDVAAPSLSQLKAWVAAGTAVRASEKPVIATKLLTDSQAADVVADPSTYFVTDDGQRYRKNAAGVDVDLPFTEGDEFVYFATSRDILGRDGPPSLPGHGIACRTLPPEIPGKLRVENHWRPDADPASSGGTQGFQVYWQSNTNGGRERTDYYELYRGTSLAPLESQAGRNTLVPLPASPFAHGDSGVIMSWLDESPETLAQDFGDSVWFSVRAVHVTPCGPVKSDFAPPVVIARRQREGPPPPSGEVGMSCPRASVIQTSITLVPDATLPANDGQTRIRLICHRRDKGIESADLSVRIGSTITDLGRHDYAAEGDDVAADFETPLNQLAGGQVFLRCQSTTHTGAVSNLKEIAVEHLTAGASRLDVTFDTRTMSDDDLMPGEVFSNELLEAPVSAAGMLVQPDGFAIVAGLGALTGRTVVIQTTAAGAAFANWTLAGHGQVKNGAVNLSLPPLAPGAPAPTLFARAFAVREFGLPQCANLAFDPGWGKAAALPVFILTTPRTAEYRLFRRINDGPYTQVGQGAATFVQGQALNGVTRKDDSLPVTSCTICYYAQTVDRDGNASAMVKLEPCIEHKAPVLPKPRLSPPASVGTAADAKLRLTWTCPPEGVERFVITVEQRASAAAQARLASTAGLSQTSANPARVVTYIEPGSGLALAGVSKMAGPAAAPVTNPNAASSSALAGSLVTWKKFLNTSRFLTAPLGNGFPAEPPFTIDLDVTPGAGYKVFVQAQSRAVRGPASAVYESTWTVETSGPEPAVAWPARPLPQVTSAAQIVAAELDAAVNLPIAWPVALQGQRPVGVRLASLPSQGHEDWRGGTAGEPEMSYVPRSPSPGFKKHDPNAHVSAPLGDGVRQVQGVVLYRQQVANALFPSVSGDTIQVSPLVRQIAWIPTTVSGLSGSRLIDPFFAVTVTDPPANASGGALTQIGLWLLDTQGVVDGARYHYFLVCFGADGEITQTIDAGFTGQP